MKCKNCKSPVEKESAIYQGIAYFCSKKCRLELWRAEVNKAKEKQKIKQKKIIKKKRNSITNLKKKLWSTISLYIRLRDSDDENHCVCCSCWDRRHYKDSIQGWHYIPSWSSSFHRYNERNIHAQCYWCNVWKGWNLIEYRPFMINKYGLKYTD